MEIYEKPLDDLLKQLENCQAAIDSAMKHLEAANKTMRQLIEQPPETKKNIDLVLGHQEAIETNQSPPIPLCGGLVASVVQPITTEQLQNLANFSPSSSPLKTVWATHPPPLSLSDQFLYALYAIPK